MQTTMDTFPPAFDATQWLNEPKPPTGYAGIKFDIPFFKSLVELSEQQGTATILGKKAVAWNIQVEVPAQDRNYPLYFEMAGAVYHYVFSVWSDRVVIEVRRPDETYALRSAMFPATEDELRTALSTIAADMG